MSIARHRVFISYYHHDDQRYKDYLIKMQEFNIETMQMQSIFEDFSVHEKEIDDAGLSSEQIRCIIRDEYIKDATVLILLCGENTKKRKHIDWELHAAMYDTGRQRGRRNFFEQAIKRFAKQNICFSIRLFFNKPCENKNI